MERDTGRLLPIKNDGVEIRSDKAAFKTGSELRAGLFRWIDYYNGRRPHSSLGRLTPDEAYAAIAAGNKRVAA